MATGRLTNQAKAPAMVQAAASVVVLMALLIATSTLVSCSSSSKTSQTTSEAKTSDAVSDLSREEAESRKARLSGITYDLRVDLTAAASKEKEARFAGDLEIRFKLKDPAKDLRVDFFEGDVTMLTVNGKTISPTQKKKYWIEIPSSVLIEGENAVRIVYSQAFSRTGEGLHRFVDPVDDRVYLYTQFEAYDANRFMPCFDQPDLRSVLKLKVKAPKEWAVISATTETSAVIQGAAREWVFAPSPEISTYLFSLHAGSYAVFKDTYKRADKTSVPLRIYVRESMKKFMQHKEWFKNTKESLGFYENYFGVNYPFGKLDQIVPPEFNMGGMENVAAITYTEWMLPRSATTRKIRRGLSGLQAHEIAHMWYGDLVTMKWWGDLWLNESFATYMASLAQAEATEFKESWQTFAAMTKSRAYIEDAMPTTHPIEAPIHRVKEAMTNFDAITYNKGASVLKQLSYYMTADDFRAGVRDYFKTYAYQNTTLNQFIGSLQKHTKKDLSLWADRWLRQSGADTVSARWTCEGDRLKVVNLKLETLDGRKARPQSMEIGLYKKAGKKLLVANQIRADFDGSSPVQDVPVKGDWACPDFVYPNHADHAYIMVKLDEKSLAFLSNGLSTVDDLTTRTMVWNDLWRMVRGTEISLKTYVDIVAKNFPLEENEVIQSQVLNSIASPSGSILSYWPPESQADRAKFVLLMETDFLKRLKNSVSGSDEEKLWYDALGRTSESSSAMEQFYKWYRAGRISRNFPVDLDRAWGIATLLSRFQHPKAAEVLTEMKKKDTSDRGMKAALAAEAASPKVEVKKKWIGEFTSAGAPSATPLSLDEAQSVLWALFPIEQRNMRLDFSKDFFGYLEKHRNSEDSLRVGSVLASLIPLNCADRESKALKEKVNQYSDMNPTFKKRFLMSLDEDERCQRVRASSSL